VASIKKYEDSPSEDNDDDPRRLRPYRARYRDAAGREHRKDFRLKRDAQAWLDRMTASVERGDHVAPQAGRSTFAEYAREWSATKVNVRRSTKVNIAGRLNKWAIPAFGQRPLDSIKPLHARRFVADLADRDLAPSTIRAIVLTTNQVFAQAVEDEMIAKSPFAKVIKDGLPSEAGTDEMRFLDAGQVDVLAAAISDRYRAAVYLAAYGGLRAGELWALRVDRIDRPRATVEVVESASEAGGWHVGPTKTGKRRTITIPRFLADMLDEHISGYSAGGFVFTAAEGGPVLHHNFKRRHYTKGCIAAGLGAMVQDDDARRAHYEGVRFHDLRHTCASLLIHAGRHLQEVKDYLGHSTIKVTSDRYAHIYPQARAAMADALDATFRDAKSVEPRTTSRTTTQTEADSMPLRQPKTASDLRELLERTTGFEPATPTLARLCSTS
jgi:integrase